MAQNDSIKMNWYRIRTFHHKGRVEDVINFRLSDLQQIEELIQKIFRSQSRKFKLNFSLGFLLQNRLTGEFCYYYASHNTAFVKEPFLIESQKDLPKVINYFQENDPIEFARQSRPNSEWVFYKLINLTAFINKVFAHPIGNDLLLPDYVTQNQALVSLGKNYKGRPYSDQKCFFRCLALHMGANISGIGKDYKSAFKTI